MLLATAASGDPALGEQATSLNGIDINENNAYASNTRCILDYTLPGDFVIIKATEGTYMTNALIQEEADWAVGSGMLIGFYHFASNTADGNNTDPAAQARYFVNVVEGTGYLGQAILILDWENTSYSNVMSEGPTWAKRWLDTVYSLTGVRSLIYMSSSVSRETDGKGNYVWSDVARDYELWAAAYPSRLATGKVNGYQYVPQDWFDPGDLGPWDKPIMHQYSDRVFLTDTKTGREYPENFDANRFFGTRSDWLNLAKPDKATPKPYANVSYRAHVQRIGWQGWAKDGALAGTTGRSLRMEALQVTLSTNVSGGISVQAHVQGIGWQSAVSAGKTSGTTGQSRRLEAVRISLTGNLAQQYDVYYRVHSQTYGWLGWAKNGEIAGTTGLSRRAEAIEIVLVPKGGSAPGSTSRPSVSKSSSSSSTPAPSVSYRAYVNGSGWQSYKKDGATAGTTGQSRAISGIRATVSGGPSGDITVQSYAGDRWWGVISGSSGDYSGWQEHQTERVRINLTGSLAQQYDVYYRVHVQSYGWLGWAKDGQTTGTSSGKRVEAVEIVLRKKGSAAPGSTSGYYR